MPSEEQLQAALEKLGLVHFRPLQREAITALCRSQDVLVCLATAGGKSLIYQLPSIITGRSVVIISPLLALAKDQVDNWNDRYACDVPACCYNSSVSDQAKADVCRALACGSPQLVYTTPESLCKDENLRSAIKLAVASEHIAAVAVDEAHCVCEWGHDFRPAYLHLKLLRHDPQLGCFGKVPFVALTATVTKDLTADIVSSLGLVAPVVLKHTFNRPNIGYAVRYKEALARTAHDLDADSVPPSVARDIARFIAEQAGATGIVYARKRQNCEDLASELNCVFDEPEFADLGLGVTAYHAGLSAFDRNKIQRQWTDGSVTAVVATVAFGLGIDKSDVRWIMHYEAPSSIEALTQESGRAGRDGLPSTSILYTSEADQQWAGKVCKDGERAKLKSVLDYCNLIRCRRSQILAYFGEKRGACDAAAGEELCDVCRDAAGVKAMQQQAAKVREGAIALADTIDSEALEACGAQADGAPGPCGKALSTAPAGHAQRPAPMLSRQAALWQKGSIYGNTPSGAWVPPGVASQEPQRAAQCSRGVDKPRAPSTHQAVLSRAVALRATPLADHRHASSRQPGVACLPLSASVPVAARSGAADACEAPQSRAAGVATPLDEARSCAAGAVDGGCLSEPSALDASPPRPGGGTPADVLTGHPVNVQRPALRKRPGLGAPSGGPQRFKAPRSAGAAEPAGGADALQPAPGLLDDSSLVGSRSAAGGGDRGLDGPLQELVDNQRPGSVLPRQKFVPPKCKMRTA